MSGPKPKPDISMPKTPLGVVGLFLTFTEVALTVGVIQTTGGIQVALTTFVLFFPIAIAATFFYVLWKRPWVYYPPSEYGPQTDVKTYVDTFRQVDVFVATSEAVRSAVTSTEVKTELASKLYLDPNIITHLAAKDREDIVDANIDRVLGLAADKAVEEVRKSSFITIRIVPLPDGSTYDVGLLYDDLKSFAQLIVEVSVRLDDFLSKSGFVRHPGQAQAEYGVKWQLRNRDTGELYLEWPLSDPRGLHFVNRDLEAVGIKPGMRFEVIEVLPGSLWDTRLVG